MAIEMNDAVRELAAEGIQTRHPEYGPAELDAALVELYHGIDAARRRSLANCE